MRFFVLLLVPTLLATAGPRGARTAAGATLDSTASAPDTSVAEIPQRDAFDLINEFLNRPIQSGIGGELQPGLEWALLPTFSYNPVYGFAVGAMISGAGRRGTASTRFSQLAISGNASTTGQIQAQVRGDVFAPSGNYLLRADLRYLDTERRSALSR